MKFFFSWDATGSLLSFMLHIITLYGKASYFKISSDKLLFTLFKRQILML
jgi:hypothetical protein